MLISDWPLNFDRGGSWVFSKNFLHGEKLAQRGTLGKKFQQVLYTNQVLCLTFKKVLSKAVAHHVTKVGESLVEFLRKKIHAPEKPYRNKDG